MTGVSPVTPPPIPRRKRAGEDGPDSPRKSPSQGTGTTDTTDTPPRRNATGPASRAQGRTAGAKLQRSLEELLSAPALAYSLAGDQWAAEFVAERAPVMAEAWAKLAEENPAVKRILMRITQGSAWGGVIVATGGTVLPLLAHHGVLPPPLDGAFNVPTVADSPRGPIVPPPPAPPGPPPVSDALNGTSRRGRDDASDMTPPLKGGQPPGVVTVAGTNAQHS